MAPEDASDAGLSLGLSIRGGHHRGKEPATSVDREATTNEPSLTLSLPDDVYGAGGPPAKVLPKAETNKLQGPASPVYNTASPFYGPYKPQGVKREKDVRGVEEAEVERVSSRASEEEEDGGGRKKLRLTKEQSALLEDRFKEHSTLNPKQKLALAKQLHLRPRQVEVWFQNRRARTKLKQTEVDCEVLKRYCETLTEENRRLHRELQELKAFKFMPPLPPLYMQFPAATLTVCPSCERVGGGGRDGPKSSGAGPLAVPAPKPQFFNPFAHSAAC